VGGALNRWLEEPEREPRLLSARPIARSPRWVERVNKPLTSAELKAVRNSVNRGSPFGDKNWVQAIAAPEPPVNPTPPRKTPKRVLTPFPNRRPGRASKTGIFSLSSIQRTFRTKKRPILRWTFFSANRASQKLTRALDSIKGRSCLATPCETATL
jgi:hypothetical protein